MSSKVMLIYFQLETVPKAETFTKVFEDEKQVEEELVLWDETTEVSVAVEGSVKIRFGNMEQIS